MSNTERTDQYPEVSGEDAALVPQQGAKPEWPKKIRTLTASELDRLTIDGFGRFYWDGKLVNYEAQTARVDKPLDLDQHALDLLDRAARELDPNAPQPSPEQAGSDVQSDGSQVPPLAATPADQLAPVAPVAEQPTPVVEVRRHDIMTPSARPETTRVLLTGWQSIGLIVVVAGLLVAAMGMAASGFVALHDWGCKTAVVKRGCAPPPPMPTPPARPDIAS
jgi:hypothetical protein